MGIEGSDSRENDEAAHSEHRERREQCVASGRTAGADDEVAGAAIDVQEVLEGGHGGRNHREREVLAHSVREQRIGLTRQAAGMRRG